MIRIVLGLYIRFVLRDFTLSVLVLELQGKSFIRCLRTNSISMSHPNRRIDGYKNIPFCTACNLSLTPITKWCQENNYSIEQAHRLLRIGYLLGTLYKRRMYVAVNPDFVGEM